MSKATAVSHENNFGMNLDSTNSVYENEFYQLIKYSIEQAKRQEQKIYQQVII